jgi:5-methylcytosine-specific restriction endonuclease McrA
MTSKQHAGGVRWVERMRLFPLSTVSNSIQKPTKSSRPGVQRRKEIKKGLKEWANTAKEKVKCGDYYTCQCCFRLFLKEQIHAHHKQTRGSRADMILDPSNADVLCFRCHANLHNQ